MKPHGSGIKEPCTGCGTIPYSLRVLLGVAILSTIAFQSLAAGVDPVFNLSTLSETNWIRLSWTNPTNLEFQGILVLRSTNSAPTGVPTDGIAYTTNSYIGGDRVTYVGPSSNSTPGTASWLTDKAVIQGTNYFYALFAYNALTNYSTGTGTNCAAVDTEPPSNVGNLIGSGGDRTIVLSWVNPLDRDFAGVLILRREDTAPTGVPVNGMTYATNDMIGSDKVVYAGIGSSGLTNAYSEWMDVGLEQGVTYHYVVFARDEIPNYSSGTHVSEVPPVPSPVIYVDRDAIGANNGNSWSNAFTNLIDALPVARTARKDIWIAEGTYKPRSGSRTNLFQLVPGVGLYGGFGGDETMGEERNWTNHPTILSGDIGVEGADADNCSHVVSADNANGAILDGLTIRKGYDYAADGAGIYKNTVTTLQIVNCIIEDNTGNYGGGIYNNHGDITIRNSIIRNNMADYRGGGFCNDNGIATVVNCLFYGNSVPSGGGAIVCYRTRLDIINCTFFGNSDTVYGDTDCTYVSEGATPFFVNCILWDDKSADARNKGGGIFEKWNGMATVTYSDVNGGWTGILGGEGNINLDPQFTNAPASDFNLFDASPCIDAGITPPPWQAGELDLNWNSRIYYANPDRPVGTNDMGCYEWPAYRYFGPPQGTLIYVR